jgi:hypothetical protein
MELTKGTALVLLGAVPPLIAEAAIVLVACWDRFSTTCSVRVQSLLRLRGAKMPLF